MGPALESGCKITKNFNTPRQQRLFFVHIVRRDAPWHVSTNIVAICVLADGGQLRDAVACLRHAVAHLYKLISVLLCR